MMVLSNHSQRWCGRHAPSWMPDAILDHRRMKFFFFFFEFDHTLQYIIFLIYLGKTGRFSYKKASIDKNFSF